MKMLRFKTRIVAVLFCCCLITVSMLLYFMISLDNKKIEINFVDKSRNIMIVGFSEVKKKNETSEILFEKQIKFKLSVMNIDNNQNEEKQILINRYIELLNEDLKFVSIVDKNHTDDHVNELWKVARKWVRARQTIPPKAKELGAILRALQTSKVQKSDVIKKGTQLKLLLTLAGGQNVLFKPKRYSREYITKDIYSGADRHNGEIIAFHLSRVLNFRYAPIVASRIFNIDEIKSVASQKLLKTFVSKFDLNFNKTLECFYGECYYCNEYDLVCPDHDGFLEGAMILMLPSQYHLQKLRHPWQRTYKKTIKAKWENDPHYCLSVIKNHPIKPRILDFVDAAIFDFLIGNADRHHYEVFKEVSNSALLLIDNGKSFGNPYQDEITILYPLLQCCMVRNSTYQHMKNLFSTKLSQIIETLLSSDVLWPLITKKHLNSLDRRFMKVMASFEICFDLFQKENVLK